MQRALQRTAARAGAAAFVAVLAAGAALAQAQPGAGRALSLSPEVLSKAWTAERRDYGLPALLDHGTVESRLKELVSGDRDLFSLEDIGRSVEGRSINHLWFGRGRFHVLLWSQMHGDEATATPALLHIAEYVHRHREEEPVRRLLRELTIHLVPMLNPDGARRYQRRNAQGIDINRDALLLQSPEGRALKALRDRVEPGLGFNLHNQNWRTSAGRSGKPASFSLLSVALDEARTMTPGRVLTKKVCAVMRRAIEVFAPGQVARYDDEFEVRAFGDNITSWGTPVVLLETGPYGGDQPDEELVRLNFVALLAAMNALATGDVHREDPAAYDDLPVNESNLFAVLIRGATIITGTGVDPFTGDVGITVGRSVRSRQGESERELVQVFRVEDLGDLRVFSGLETIDAKGLYIAPAWDEALKEGIEVSVPDWTTVRSKVPLTPGSPASLVILRPLADDRYKVERVIGAEKTMGS